MQTFEAGSWAWVPDAKEMYLPAKVQKTFKGGEEGKVKMEDGKVSRGGIVARGQRSQGGSGACR